MKTRREFLSITAGTAGAMFLANTANLFGADAKAAWKIGICDWNVNATGRLGAFATAKELGYEGIQASYQPTGQDTMSMRENRTKFSATAKETGVEMASLAMGILNGSPLATTPEAELWVVDCLNAMDEMNVSQVLLAFFGRADLTQNQDHMPLVIEKLKRLAPIAERKKKVLAFESTLSAEEHVKLLDAVGSDALKVYYDVENSRGKGYDIFHEMKLLGSKKLISEIHFKENGARLGAGKIDFVKVRDTLQDVGYGGWVIVEGSVTGDWKESQAANAQYVKKLIGR